MLRFFFQSTVYRYHLSQIQTKNGVLNVNGTEEKTKNGIGKSENEDHKNRVKRYNLKYFSK